jgi:hypothetical protein
VVNGSDLKHVLYVSHLSPEAASRLPSTMADILVTSHHRNKRSEISGFLWSDGALFAQVLEGSAAEVDAIFGRIAADQRHCEIRLCLDAPLYARAFPRWSMCGMTLSDLDETLLAPKDIEHDLLSVTPGAILAMLTRFASAYGEQLDHVHDQLRADATGVQPWAVAPPRAGASMLIQRKP